MTAETNNVRRKEASESPTTVDLDDILGELDADEDETSDAADEISA